MPLDERTLAYLAGLMDGEGYIGFSAARSRKSVNTSYNGRVMIVNTDKALTTWLSEEVGGSVLVRPRFGERWKTAYAWVVYGENAAILCGALVPFLRLKRRQADILVAFRHLGAHQGRLIPAETLAARQGLVDEMQALNRKGPLIA